MARSVNQVSSIVSWNRLETRPKSAEFNRSLRAELRDPLWMLTRQWQIGEFKGEDRVSPLFSNIEIETTKLTDYKPGFNANRPYEDGIPLEAQVEREPMPIDWGLKIQMGNMWMKFLKRHNLSSARRQRFLSHPRYKILYPSPSTDSAGKLTDFNKDYLQLIANKALSDLVMAADGKTIDGYILYVDLTVSPNTAHDLFVGANALTSQESDQLTNAVDEFKRWFGKLYYQPAPNDSAWVPAHLEYQFKVKAPLDTASTVLNLHADEYYQGRLDWYSFDQESSQTPILVKNDPAPIEEQPNNQEQRVRQIIKTRNANFIPNGLKFAGMPNARWWAMEDQDINLSKVKVDSSDPNRLLFLEFMFIYNNDWFSFPQTVEVGSICTVKSLYVYDMMGRKHEVKSAGNSGGDWGKWCMYSINERGRPDIAPMRVFIPPAVTHLQEGKPIEKVNFVRDEMANMVWAVEQIVPNGLGGGINGLEAATSFGKALAAKLPAAPTSFPIANTAKIKYQLANTVPENWIPFIPVRATQTSIAESHRAVQLQRASMPRYVEGLNTGSTVVAGRTGIVNREPAPYFVHEEEVARAGSIVTSGFQRTRWLGGQTFVWLGRQKNTGRGESNSGLLYDQLLPKVKP